MSLKKRIAAAAAAAVVGVALVWGSTSGALFSDEQTATVNGDVGTTNISLTPGADGNCTYEAVANALLPGVTVQQVCTVTNDGSTNVTLSVVDGALTYTLSPPLSVSGRDGLVNPLDLTATAVLGSTTLAPGASTTLTVTVTLNTADNDWQDATAKKVVTVHADQA